MAEPRPGLHPAVAAVLLVAGAAGIGAGCIVGGIAAAEAILAARPERFASEAAAEALFTALIFAPMLVFALLARRFTVTPAPDAQLLRHALLGLAIGTSGLLVAAGLAGLSRSVTAGSAGGATALLAVGAALTLLQAGAEEALLRGWLQPALGRLWPGWAAILASSLLFMALHLLGGERAPLALVNLFLGGLFFGLLAHRAGGLAAPIAAHWAWNSAETLLLGLSPNPGTGPFGALFDLDLVGAAAWGGSDQGLNASVALTLVLLALILPLAAWRPGVPRRSTEPPPRHPTRHAFFLGEET